MFFSEKNYPPTVTLRKIWIGLACVSALCLAMVILYNLFHATSKQLVNRSVKENQRQLLANTSDTKWYQDHGRSSKLDSINTIAPNASNTLSLRTDQSLAKNIDPDRAKEAKEAMSAAIHSNQLTGESFFAKEEGRRETTGSQSTFFKNPPSSPYVVQAGTLIAGILITGIHSDLPGQMIGQVRSPVYDSITGRYCLIPQGSKLLGVYDAKIIYGQERVFVAWQRLLLPNGQSMDLSDMAGVDNSGYTGFTDRVNAHTGKLFGSAMLMSVLGAGAHLGQLSADHTALTDSPIRQALSQNIAASVMTTASALTEKNLHLQPTLEIRSGFTFNILVTKDLIFPKPYDETLSEETECVGTTS